MCVCVCFALILIKSLDYCINILTWSTNKNSWLHPSYNKNSRTLTNTYQMARKKKILFEKRRIFFFFKWFTKIYINN